MRTTVTLDPDVEQLLRAEERRSGDSFKLVLNRAIRSSLASDLDNPSPYEPPIIKSRLLPGIDIAGFNRLVDELETDEVLKRL